MEMEFEHNKNKINDFESQYSEIQNINNKIEMFKKKTWSLNEIKEFYRFNPINDKFQEKYKAWYKGKFQKEIDYNNINVWSLEEYLKWQGFIQVDFAAAKLGMKTESFKRVIDDYLEELVPKIYFTEEIIYKEVVEDIAKYLFIKEKVNIYKSHTDYCEKIHKRLKEIGIEVEPLLCETSMNLHEHEILVASTFDNFTGEPVSEKYSIWLEFGKPISLKPYICSLNTYSKYQDLLKPYLMGEEPEENLILTLKRNRNEWV